MYRIGKLTQSGKRRGKLSRYRSHLAVLSACGTLAIGALAAPLPANAAATWKTHVFSVSFDGTGKYNYNSQGANGDTGCYMNATQVASYSFDQLWTIRIGFKSTGKGTFATKIESINHVDGPQNFGDKADSHLTGKQTELPDEDCAQINIQHNIGTYDCTSKTVTLTAFPNPQMEISRAKGDLVMEGRAFLDGHWKFTGTDTIPSDKKLGCKTYEDDMTYGTDLIPGDYATTKVSLAARALNNLGKGKSISVPISFGKNTKFPRQSVCDPTFGKPSVCTIHSQGLTAKFKLIKVR
jgi:hypothetical protein